MKMHPGVAIAIAFLAVFSPKADAHTQRRLPVSLALQAIEATIGACERSGHSVAVAVVNPDGIVQAEARGDGSPIHSQRFAYRKAYTVMSMGPMFSVSSSAELAETITKSNPVGLSNITAGQTELLFLPGGLLIERDGEAIAAIGVSGASTSIQDEACAKAGLDVISAHLDERVRNQGTLK